MSGRTFHVAESLTSITTFTVRYTSGAGFIKGLKSKIKVLNVKNFVIKLRQNLCVDKMGFIKCLGQNFVLSYG